MSNTIIVNEHLKRIIAEYYGNLGLQVLKFSLKITKAIQEDPK